MTAKTPIQVFFVYRRSTKRLGSTVMRGFQLCEIMRSYGSGRFQYDMRVLPTLHVDPLRLLWARAQPRDAIYIFIKNTVDRLSPQALEVLWSRARAIVHDPIDRSIEVTPKSFVDLHLATSIAQQSALTDWIGARSYADGKVGLLLHQADIRFENGLKLPKDRFRPGYFGFPENAYLPDPIARRVRVSDVGLVEDMNTRLGAFSDANFHYAVRPKDQTNHDTVFKPLTKAVTAAACGAPVMVNRAAHDAEALLGHDYPYLIDAVDTETILAALDRAENGFGGAEWSAALDKMKELRARLSPPSLARALEELLETAR